MKALRSHSMKESGLFLLFFIVGGLHQDKHFSKPFFQDKTAVYWAETLVAHITSQNTDYRHKDNTVTWAGNNEAGVWQCIADCSGFINALLKQTYGWDEAYFKKWLGKSRPLAYLYFDAITAENNFTRIRQIGEVKPGDLIALKYSDRSEHEDNTGHCMLVVKTPTQCTPVPLIEPSTEQYELTVIDCSKSPHGKTDTRFVNDNEQYSGLGKGIFRLYTDRKGNIAAYSWSTGRPKSDFNPYANAIVVGRLKLQ